MLLTESFLLCVIIPQANLKRESSLQKAILTFTCADLETLHFPTATFDAILCSSALVFLQDIPSTLTNWHHWLNPTTGRVVFNSPKRHASAAFEIFASEGAKHGAGFIEDPSEIFSTEQDVLKILKNAGFSKIEISTSSEGRDYPGMTPEDYANTLWNVCSKSPFSPVENLVSPEAAAAWKEGFLSRTVEFVLANLIDGEGLIRDSHDMFWVVGRE